MSEKERIFHEIWLAEQRINYYVNLLNIKFGYARSSEPGQYYYHDYLQWCGQHEKNMDSALIYQAGVPSAMLKGGVNES